MALDINLNVNFLNSIMDTPPPWAVELKQMVAEGLAIMARAEDKLAELEGLVTNMGSALSGISNDLQVYADQRAADAAEIAALKQAVLDAQSNAGELSPELASRFDALKASLETAVQQANDLDARLPNVPATPAEPTPTPTEPPPTA